MDKPEPQPQRVIERTGTKKSQQQRAVERTENLPAALKTAPTAIESAKKNNEVMTGGWGWIGIG
jgi:hypothetical protein